jgi:DNA-directed RNA polymerase
VHERNYVRRSKAIAFAKIISTAKTLLDQQDEFGNKLPFYFPYNLDFRGRVYTIPAYLQPQGDDVARGLLHFADGKALDTPEAEEWLAIHGANCLAEISGIKLDKLPLAERAQWVRDNSAEIVAVAEDPFTNDWWMSVADTPFQFLAFCFEWAQYQREGCSFLSRIPVAMDGSCNGLQHYSALLRDTTGGRAVNLIPSDKPNDIYQQVADAVNVRLEREAQDGNEYALAWVKWGRVDRKLCKRPVMTLPYGAKKHGFSTQTSDFIQDKVPRADWPEFFDPLEKKPGRKELAYLSGVLWETLESTVVSAIEGMDYFQGLVRLLVQQDIPVSWSVPTGLHVAQIYPKTEMYRVKTKLAGSVFMPRLMRTIPDAVDSQKQVNGIAPNIIHSLDACALMLAVCEAGKQGINCFSMVHDSFGTHAADAALLNRITRETFVGMYLDNDILAGLESDLLAHLDTEKVSPDALPARPKVGDLALESVLESDYFFA